MRPHVPRSATESPKLSVADSTSAGRANRSVAQSGSEHLSYKQGVGDSNSSASTNSLLGEYACPRYPVTVEITGWNPV